MTLDPTDQMLLTAICIAAGMLLRVFLNLRKSLTSAESENTRLRQALAESEERERDANEANIGLTEELDNWHAWEKAKQQAKVMVH